MHAGDIILLRGKYKRSKQIVWAQNTARYFPKSTLSMHFIETYYSHIAMHLGYGLFIESTKGVHKGVILSSYSELINEKPSENNILVYRYKALSENDTIKIGESLFDYIGREYHLNMWEHILGIVESNDNTSFCAELIINLFRQIPNIEDFFSGIDSANIYPIHFHNLRHNHTDQWLNCTHEYVQLNDEKHDEKHMALVHQYDDFSKILKDKIYYFYEKEHDKKLSDFLHDIATYQHSHKGETLFIKFMLEKIFPQGFEPKNPIHKEIKTLLEKEFCHLKDSNTIEEKRARNIDHLKKPIQNLLTRIKQPEQTFDLMTKKSFNACIRNSSLEIEMDARDFACFSVRSQKYGFKNLIITLYKDTIKFTTTLLINLDATINTGETMISFQHIINKYPCDSLYANVIPDTNLSLCLNYNKILTPESLIEISKSFGLILNEMKSLLVDDKNFNSYYNPYYSLSS